jgi:hypothetical protein
MLQIVRTYRLLCAPALFVALLLGSGYLGILALCCDFDDLPHVEVISFGCCHCTERGTPASPPPVQLDVQHEHCTDVEMSFSFVRVNLSSDCMPEYIPVTNPGPLPGRIPDCADRTGRLYLDNSGPPLVPRHQIIAALSTTVIIC